MLIEIQAQLEAVAMPPLKLVAGAAEFQAAARHAPPRGRQPAAYVIPIAETGGPNSLVNAVRQQVVARVGVVLALGNLEDPRGQGATKALEGVRAGVRGALLGFAPTTDDDPLTFVRGAAVAFRDNVLWWLDEYQSGFTVSG